MPSAEMAQDRLDDARVVDEGDDAHRVLADGTAERVDMPDAEDQIAPLFGGDSGASPGARLSGVWGE